MNGDRPFLLDSCCQHRHSRRLPIEQAVVDKHHEPHHNDMSTVHHSQPVLQQLDIQPRPALCIAVEATQYTLVCSSQLSDSTHTAAVVAEKHISTSKEHDVAVGNSLLVEQKYEQQQA